MDTYILEQIIPWIIAVVAVVITFWYKYKRLPQTEEDLEWIKEGSEHMKELLDEVIAFFVSDAPITATSKEALEYIPKVTYEMSAASESRVLATCATEEEKRTVMATIDRWETSEDPTDYILETSGATYHVQYGVPEVISTPVSTGLSQSDINRIIEEVGKNNEFLVMWTILDAERKGLTTYQIVTESATIEVNGNTWSYPSQVTV